MLVSKIDIETISKAAVNKIIFDVPKDDNMIGDCIFVFGNIQTINERVGKAVQLYRDGRATKILFSGGFGNNARDKSEALLMKQSAMALGIPEKDILIEQQSTNTAENVIASLFVLEKEFKLRNVKRLIVVASSVQIRRCMLTLSRYMPKWISFSYCSDGFVEKNIDNPQFVEFLHKKSKDEAICVVNYAKQGFIDDFEMN